MYRAPAIWPGSALGMRGQQEYIPTVESPSRDPICYKYGVSISCIFIILLAQGLYENIPDRYQPRTAPSQGHVRVVEWPDPHIALAEQVLA